MYKAIKKQSFLLVILSIIGINIFYSINLPEDEKIINSNIWWSTFDKSSKENDIWVKVGDLELSTKRTEISILNPNNPLGLTYNLHLKIRYQIKNKENAVKQISQLKELSNNQNRDVPVTEFIPTKPEIPNFDDFLFLGTRGKSFNNIEENAPDYAYGDYAYLQFYTSIIPDKAIEFKVYNGSPIYVRTNPLVIFQTEFFQFPLLILVLVISTIILNWRGQLLHIGFIGAVCFWGLFDAELLKIGISDYSFWVYLFCLWIVSIFFQIRMRKLVLPKFLKPFTNWKILVFVIIVGIFVVYKYIVLVARDYVDSFSILNLFYSIMIFAFICSMLWATITSLYEIYLHFRFPKIKINDIRFFNEKITYVSSGAKRTPVFSADIEFEGIVIKEVDIV